MTSSENEPSDGAEESTGLLVLRDAGTGEPDDRAVDRLCEILDARGFRRGHRVGLIIAVTGPTDWVRTLEQHVEACQLGERPSDADPGLLDAIDGVVDGFAWDEGAETF